MSTTAISPDAGTPSTGPSSIALVSQRQRAWRSFKRNKSAVVGLVMIIGLVFIALFAPLIAPHDPIQQSTINRLAPPSSEYWLGRDDYGRDVFSRIIY